jgi:DHA1 family multidrug resistance protein-like MFS transporter
MSELIRDSFFGHCVRLVTGGRVFRYPEEVDSTKWQRYIDHEKSAHMARHGQPYAPEGVEKQEGRGSPAGTAREDHGGAQDHRTSSATPINDSQEALFNGRPRNVDQEKGKDSYIVSWYGPEDPEVSVAGIATVLQCLVCSKL